MRHTELLVFGYVFADQLGAPLPAVPALLGIGALAATGKINPAVGLVLIVAACLLADLIWYGLGRRLGPRVLRLLCKISLEQDSCVRRTQDTFIRYGVRALIVAKFVPGLGTVAPSVAGMVGVGAPRFAVYSALGALLWGGTWAGLGYLAGDLLKQLPNPGGVAGVVIGVAVVMGIIGYVVARWLKRRRFLHNLRIARIEPDQLLRDIESATPALIVDLRSDLDVAADPYVIPGALRIAAEELERRHAKIPRDQEIVVYCS
ncbi:MAG TPA: VTT domain-containing protein [Methylomirabilota bacterium]|jgi:membrane protein DedA with SNARE-associated domain